MNEKRYVLSDLVDEYMTGLWQDTDRVELEWKDWMGYSALIPEENHFVEFTGRRSDDIPNCPRQGFRYKGIKFYRGAAPSWFGKEPE